MRTGVRGLATLVLISAGCISLLAQTQLGARSALLRLKSGLHYAPTKALILRTPGDDSKQSTHFVAIFRTVPNALDARNLRARGYSVFASVPDNGLLVYGNSAADLSSLGVAENYSLLPADKLSSKLNSRSASPLSVIVELHPDADLGTVWLRMLIAGIALLPNQDLNSTDYLVQAPYASLRKLAGWDEVAYIYPASPQMISGQKVVACAIGYSGGTAQLGVAANLVATFGDGWAGPPHGAASLFYLLHASALPLPETDVRSALQAVLAQWSTYAAITFTPSSYADAYRNIDILFASGEHGDGFPFQRSGAVLAHTFYPPPNPEPIAGDMHLNRDEAWSVNGSLQLYAVMLHEMGHALGLGHSDNPADVMYPYYQRTELLAAGDIQALRTLYAAPTAPVTPTPVPADPDPPFISVIPTVPSTPTQPSKPPSIPPVTPPVAPKTPVRTDTIPPFVRIYSPAMTASLTYKASLTVKGFATDNKGVTQITWSNSAGGSGSINAADPFVITGIALVAGVNRILIQAHDLAGNVGSAYVNVTKR